MPPKASSKLSSQPVSRTSTALQKTEILINVYDLLPPGRLSSFLWTIGSSLLHSGVVINDREYAYGGHNRRGVTGVYWTKPHFEPPGGTFRVNILHGFTFRTPEEIAAIIREVSEQFLGRNYNLLTNNCNHFTSALCERLTSKHAPPWINRAASVGLAMPCIVPREWITPPDYETADGALMEDDEEADDERSAMLSSDWMRRMREEEEDRTTSRSASSDNNAHSLAGGRRLLPAEAEPSARPVSLKDSSGRELPPAERAPLPRR